MKWNKNTKDKISYCIASLGFIFGIAITVAGFITAPLGIIHSSVLWVLGQCLTYSGAVFGVGLYVNNQKQEINTMIKKRQKNLED